MPQSQVQETLATLWHNSPNSNKLLWRLSQTRQTDRSKRPLDAREESPTEECNNPNNPAEAAVASYLLRIMQRGNKVSTMKGSSGSRGGKGECQMILLMGMQEDHERDSLTNWSNWGFSISMDT
ncbi:unnamed protein product, partial [Ceratitis capitata]